MYSGSVGCLWNFWPNSSGTFTGLPWASSTTSLGTMYSTAPSRVSPDSVTS